MTVKVDLLYFEGCPHWKIMAQQLDELAADMGFTWSPVLVETPELAVQLSFRGSPSIQIDGRDPFAAPDDPVSFSCRLYETPTGPSGTPALEMLRQALQSA